MAIVFEQPQPIDVQAAYGAAAREAMERDRQFALQAWKTQADQANEQQRMGQQAYQFEAQRMPSARDVYQTQAGLQEMGQRQQFAERMQQSGFAQQQEMQTREFTNADRMRLDRLNANRAQVDGMVASGIISPQQRDGYLQTVTADVNGLQVLQQESMERHRKQQEQREAEQVANETARRVAAENAANMGLNPPKPHFITGPNGQQLQWNHGQRRYEELAPPAGAGGASGGAQGSGSRGASGRAAGASQFDPEWFARAVDSIAQERDGTTPRFPTHEAQVAEATRRAEVAAETRRQFERNEERNEVLRVGGTVPFASTMPTNPEVGPPEDPTRMVQRVMAEPLSPRNLRQRLHVGIQASMTNGDTATERALREVSQALIEDRSIVSLLNGNTTQGSAAAGAVAGANTPNPESHRIVRALRAVGYYHGEFTPALDREIETRASQYDRSTSLDADIDATPIADRIRQRLVRYGRVEAMPPAVKQQYQLDMSRLGLDQRGVPFEMNPPRTGTRVPGEMTPVAPPPPRSRDPFQRYIESRPEQAGRILG
jgi:hypothetical protein